jgi:hypothetical protein
MTGPLRTKPVVDPGEDAQFSEPTGEPLAWQRELDVAIADIDSRLTHPRRRASDGQPALPQLGQLEITSEAIDEIAWRVAELLRGNGSEPVQPGAMADAISETVATPPKRAARAPLPPPPREPEPERLPNRVVLSIRIRRPFFRWPFRRRYRKQRMITFSDYRIT